MLNLIQGDLGVSDLSGLGVWNLYISRLPNTLILAFSSLVIGSVVAIPLGIFAARHSGKIADNITTTFSLIGMSMPGFWLGLLLLFLFSLRLGWLPAGGNRDGFKSLILPAVCSGFMLMAQCTRQTRSSMLEVLKADYLRTARAKGMPEEAVIRKHALGNAWIPILTTMGNSLSVSIAGSAVIESVFAWPGVGRTIVEAALSRDVTMTLGSVIMTTFLFVFVQLLVDVMYSFVDPRIKSKFSNMGRKKKKVLAVKSGGGDRPHTGLVAALSNELHSDASGDVPGGIRSGSEAGARETAGTFYSSVPSVQGGIAAAQISGGLEAPEKEEPPGLSFASEGVAEPEENITDAQVLEAGSVRDTGHDQGEPKSDKKKSAPEGGVYEMVSRQYRKRSLLGDIFYRIRKNKGALAGMIILAIVVLTLLASLFVSFEAATDTNVRIRFTAPNAQFPLGTDGLGRNLALRVVYGTRYSISIGVGVVAIAAFFGVMLGSVAGYFGGHVENVIMRVFDVLASIPSFLLGIVIVTTMGQSLQNLIIAVGITTMPVFVRISRASILTVRDNEFVEAARAIGLPNIRIILTQVLPNGLSPIIVTMTSSLGVSILVAASLSFIGFGVPAPHPEWGAMISTGRDYIRTAPWITTFPGICIMLVVLAFNLLGDGLRDALDPRLKK